MSAESPVIALRSCRLHSQPGRQGKQFKGKVEVEKTCLPPRKCRSTGRPTDAFLQMDDGTELEHPWLLSFLTCAAPYAPSIGQPEAGDLLQRRIGRVLAIAREFGYSAVVLGARGCGAFANDPRRTAVDFRKALETEFSGSFSDVVFAITDWSPERRFLGPFCEVFMPSTAPLAHRQRQTAPTVLSTIYD